MRPYPFEVYLANLEGEFQHIIDAGGFLCGYSTKKEAYEDLKNATGQDFGYDVAAWRQHIDAHGGPQRYRPPTPDA